MMQIDQPPPTSTAAEFSHLAGQKCIVVGHPHVIIGVYNEKGECVLNNPWWYRPVNAMNPEENKHDHP